MLPRSLNELNKAISQCQFRIDNPSNIQNAQEASVESVCAYYSKKVFLELKSLLEEIKKTLENNSDSDEVEEKIKEVAILIELLPSRLVQAEKTDNIPSAMSYLPSSFHSGASRLFSYINRSANQPVNQLASQTPVFETKNFSDRFVLINKQVFPLEERLKFIPKKDEIIPPKILEAHPGIIDILLASEALLENIHSHIINNYQVSENYQHTYWEADFRYIQNDNVITNPNLKMHQHSLVYIPDIIAQDAANHDLEFFTNFPEKLDGFSLYNKVDRFAQGATLYWQNNDGNAASIIDAIKQWIHRVTGRSLIPNLQDFKVKLNPQSAEITDALIIRNISMAYSYDAENGIICKATAEVKALVYPNGNIIIINKNTGKLREIAYDSSEAKAINQGIANNDAFEKLPNMLLYSVERRLELIHDGQSFKVQPDIINISIKSYSDYLVPNIEPDEEVALVNTNTFAKFPEHVFWVATYKPNDKGEVNNQDLAQQWQTPLIHIPSYVAADAADFDHHRTTRFPKKFDDSKDLDEKIERFIEEASAYVPNGSSFIQQETYKSIKQMMTSWIHRVGGQALIPLLSLFKQQLYLYSNFPLDMHVKNNITLEYDYDNEGYIVIKANCQIKSLLSTNENKCIYIDKETGKLSEVDSLSEEAADIFTRAASLPTMIDFSVEEKLLVFVADNSHKVKPIITKAVITSYSGELIPPSDVAEVERFLEASVADFINIEMETTNQTVIAKEEEHGLALYNYVCQQLNLNKKSVITPETSDKQSHETDKSISQKQSSKNLQNILEIIERMLRQSKEEQNKGILKKAAVFIEMLSTKEPQANTSPSLTLFSGLTSSLTNSFSWSRAASATAIPTEKLFTDVLVENQAIFSELERAKLKDELQDDLQNIEHISTDDQAILANIHCQLITDLHHVYWTIDYKENDDNIVVENTNKPSTPEMGLMELGVKINNQVCSTANDVDKDLEALIMSCHYNFFEKIIIKNSILCDFPGIFSQVDLEKICFDDSGFNIFKPTTEKTKATRPHTIENVEKNFTINEKGFITFNCSFDITELNYKLAENDMTFYISPDNGKLIQVERSSSEAAWNVHRDKHKHKDKSFAPLFNISFSIDVLLDDKNVITYNVTNKKIKNYHGAFHIPQNLDIKVAYSLIAPQKELQDVPRIAFN